MKAAIFPSKNCRLQANGGAGVPACGAVVANRTSFHWLFNSHRCLPPARGERRRARAVVRLHHPAGLAVNFGSADGTGNAARFDFPEGVAVDSAGNVYVADIFNNEPNSGKDL
jgi:NHL repeat-containing protein